jgi:hypothetical protein
MPVIPITWNPKFQSLAISSLRRRFRELRTIVVSALMFARALGTIAE